MALQFPENPTDGEYVSDNATGRVWQWDDFKTRWILIKQYFIPVPGPTGTIGPQGIPGPPGESIKSTVPGPKGDKGDAGFGVNLLGTVATESSLPVAANVATGDAYWVLDTETISIRTEAIEWANGIAIRGPSGATGPDGVPGKDGVNGEKGDDGLAICEVVAFPPAKGPKGKLFIDNLNRVYVTTGL